jgi:hypothetical protein
VSFISCYFLAASDVSFVIIQADFIFQVVLIVDEIFPTKLKNLKQFNLIKNEGGTSKEISEVKTIFSQHFNAVDLTLNRSGYCVLPSALS